jgi:hypothetical protein
MNSLKIITGFDGAAPFSADGITEKENGTFEARPSWRPSPGISEEALGSGSRFSIKVQNSSDTEEIFRCHINWQDEEKKRLRHHDWVSVLFPGAEDWTMRPAGVDDSGARISLPLPLGITHIGTSPWYGYETAINYLNSKAGIFSSQYRSIGKSEENRDIPLLLIDDSKGWKNKEDFLYMGRNHAYESAGSYCAEGMIDFLLSDDPLAEYFRAKYRFHFLPMTNPDGTHNGMSRLTAPQGADLNRCRKQNDAAWQALKDYVDESKPTLLLNIHNWMIKTKDGLLANTKTFAENFMELMPDQHEDGHKWLVEWNELFLTRIQKQKCPEESESWKNYAQEKFNATCLTLEFPWFNRTTKRMKEIGKKALTAFLMAEKY